MAIGREHSITSRRAAAAERRHRSLLAWRIVTETQDLATAALAAALAGITRGEEALSQIDVESSIDVKRIFEAAEIAHRIYRLASGQSTSNVAHASLSDEERREHLRELYMRLNQLGISSDSLEEDAERTDTR